MTNLPDIIREHRLCHDARCDHCPTMKQIADHITTLAQHNHERYMVVDMWQVTAVRRHERTVTVTIEETGETRTVHGFTVSEQYTMHLQLVNRGSYDKESYHVTISGSFFEGQDRRGDEHTEWNRSVVHIDGNFVATYPQALQALTRKEKEDLRSFEGIIAWTIAKPAIEQQFLRVSR